MNPKLEEVVKRKLISILEKPGDLRTETERKYIVKILQKNEFFDHHIDKMLKIYDILYDLSGDFKIEKIPKSATLMSFGDAADKFYIVLKGKAWIYVPKTEQEINQELKERANIDPKRLVGASKTLIEADRLLRKQDITKPKTNFTPRLGQKFSFVGAHSETDLDDVSVDVDVSRHMRKPSNMYSPRKSTADLELSMELEKRVKEGLLKVNPEMLKDSPFRQRSSPHEETHKKSKMSTHRNQVLHKTLFARSKEAENKEDLPTLESKKLKSLEVAKKERDSIKPMRNKNLRGVRLSVADDNGSEDEGNDSRDSRDSRESPSELPNLYSYLQSTPIDMLSHAEIAFLSNRKNASQYLKNGVVTFKKVSLVESGDYFGERALFNNAARLATVIASEDMCVVTLKKDAFQVIFQHQQEKTQTKMQIISQLFQNMWSAELKKLMVCFNEVTYKINDYIYQERDKINGFYIVKEGSVKLVNTIDFTKQQDEEVHSMSKIEAFKSHKKVQHTIALLGPNQIFGHEDLLDKSKCRKLSAVSEFRTVLYHMNIEEFKQYTNLHNHPTFLETLRGKCQLTQEWREQQHQKFQAIKGTIYPDMNKKSPLSFRKTENMSRSPNHSMLGRVSSANSLKLDDYASTNDRSAFTEYFKHLHGGKITRDFVNEEQGQVYSSAHVNPNRKPSTTTNVSSDHKDKDGVFQFNRLQKQARKNLDYRHKVLSFESIAQTNPQTNSQTVISHLSLRSPTINNSSVSKKEIPLNTTKGHLNTREQWTFNNAKSQPAIQRISTAGTIFTGEINTGSRRAAYVSPRDVKSSTSLSKSPRRDGSKTQLKDILHNMQDASTSPPIVASLNKSRSVQAIDEISTTLHRHLANRHAGSLREENDYTPLYSPVTRHSEQPYSPIQLGNRVNSLPGGTIFSFDDQQDSPSANYRPTMTELTPKGVKPLKKFMKSKHNMFRVTPNRDYLIGDRYGLSSPKPKK